MTDPSVHVAHTGTGRDSMSDGAAPPVARPGPRERPPEDDRSFQARMLDGVSRTFALTIPQLPDDLHEVVANAYLLCRIVDTIEDEPTLDPAQKRAFCRRFAEVVDGEGDPRRFGRDLAPRLSEHTLAPERELVRRTDRVIAITRGFEPDQSGALARCVRIMADGMARFQETGGPPGLEDLEEMDLYCYHVAGVVGEMLTELFCIHAPGVRRSRDELMDLARSFGQGLQMTNILKDVWDDQARGACWLPRDVFRDHGFDLERDLVPGRKQEAFARAFDELIAVAHGHLRNALRYVLLIPPREVGIRKFCLWALGMAVLTLDKVHRHLDFTDGSQVKISRRAVRATIAATHLAVGRDLLLKTLFRLAAARLPEPVPQPGG